MHVFRIGFVRVGSEPNEIDEQDRYESTFLSGSDGEGCAAGRAEGDLAGEFRTTIGTVAAEFMTAGGTELGILQIRLPARCAVTHD
jgi:hypothetical protein